MAWAILAGVLSFIGYFYYAFIVTDDRWSRAKMFVCLILVTLSALAIVYFEQSRVYCAQQKVVKTIDSVSSQYVEYTTTDGETHRRRNNLIQAGSEVCVQTAKSEIKWWL